MGGHRYREDKRKGLFGEIGEAAINPVPKEMIKGNKESNLQKE